MATANPQQIADLISRLTLAEQKSAENEMRIAELEAKLAKAAAAPARAAGSSRGGATNCSTVHHWVASRVQGLFNGETRWNDVHVPRECFEKFLQQDDIVRVVPDGAVRDDALAQVDKVYAEHAAKLAENAAKVGKGKGKAKELPAHPTAISVARAMVKVLNNDDFKKLSSAQRKELNSAAEVAEIAGA